MAIMADTAFDGPPPVSRAPSLGEVTQALDVLLPAMVVDGGGVQIVSVDDTGLVLKLVGSCTFCPSRRMSAEALARGLRARVPRLGGLRIVTDGRHGCEEIITVADSQAPG